MVVGVSVVEHVGLAPFLGEPDVLGDGSRIQEHPDHLDAGIAVQGPGVSVPE